MSSAALNTLSSSTSGGFWLAVSVFIGHQQEKNVWLQVYYINYILCI